MNDIMVEHLSLRFLENNIDMIDYSIISISGKKPADHWFPSTGSQTSLPMSFSLTLSLTLTVSLTDFWNHNAFLFNIHFSMACFRFS